MANVMHFPLRTVLEKWCGNGSLEGTNFNSNEIGNTCFIWVEPVTQGNDELFRSYFASIDELLEALKAQPERQISEAIISTPKHYLRLLADTSNLLPANHQPCFVLHKQLDDSASGAQIVEQTVYSQQELDKRFSEKAQEANTSLKKQQWVFKQQGIALFFVGEVMEKEGSE